MARIIPSLPNATAPDSDYPYGRIKDNDGTGNGTPVNEFTNGDFHQFFARIMALAGIPPNGLPDNDYNGFQLFDAISSFIGLKVVDGTAGGDFNNFIEPGVYAIRSNPANSPVTFVSADGASPGFLVVSKGTSTVEVYQHVLTTRGTMRRIKTVGGAFQSWSGTYIYPLLSGSWNMDTAASISFVHGLDASKIKRVTAKVTADGVGGAVTQLDAYTNQAVQGGCHWDATNIILERLTGGIYDGAGYVSTILPADRCEVEIQYGV